MKNILLLFAVLIAISGCKRKQELRNLEGGQIIANGPETCYNGVLDGDEFFIDCGGGCTPCNFPVAPCNPTLNTIKMGTASYSTFPNPGSSYTFSGSYTSGFAYNLVVQGFDLTKIYKIVNDPGSSVSYGQAKMYLSSSGFSFADIRILSGDVYITKVGTVYYATICNAIGKYNSLSTTFTFEAKLTY